MVEHLRLTHTHTHTHILTIHPAQSLICIGQHINEFIYLFILVFPNDLQTETEPLEVCFSSIHLYVLSEKSVFSCIQRESASMLAYCMSTTPTMNPPVWICFHHLASDLCVLVCVRAAVLQFIILNVTVVSHSTPVENIKNKYLWEDL